MRQDDCLAQHDAGEATPTWHSKGIFMSYVFSGIAVGCGIVALFVGTIPPAVISGGFAVGAGAYRIAEALIEKRGA